MTKLEFIKAHRRTIGFAVGTIVLAISVVAGARALGSAYNEHRINKLEAEKQQFLKERDEARARDLILQGQIQAKDQQIADLTSRIAESDQKVVIAHNDTQSARSNYNKVRADGPHFNASDDAGRVRELSSDLHGLYSDPPR